MTCPCKDCTERHEACHGQCERYGTWKAYKERGRQARRADHDAMDAVMSGTVKRRDKWVKSQVKRGKSQIRR